ncbi:MAG: hypothetical protein LC772_02500, partial [Chloroflexi bacterium]|nr:hypothetical protein [Chloroflexota bacterium]
MARAIQQGSGAGTVLKNERQPDAYRTVPHGRRPSLSGRFWRRPYLQQRCEWTKSAPCHVVV